MTHIIGSVGTDHHHFDRLVHWLAFAGERLDAEVTLQYGSTPRADGVEGFDYLPPAQLGTLMCQADAVVCHGGPGTIALARSVGHRPIVVPRDPAFGEHVDDHQVRYCARMEVNGLIDVARSSDELVVLLQGPRERFITVDDGAAATVEQFASLIRALLAGELPSRSWRDRVRLRRRAVARSAVQRS